jgi:NitT/TauT family transport system substrate-binding protein
MAALAGLMAASLAACGSSPAGTHGAPLEKTSLTVTVVPASGAAAVYIAQQDGYFAAAGLHVKIVPVASSANVVSDLVNGSVDVTEGQWTTGLAAAAHGVRLRALAPGNSGGPGLQVLAVPADSPVTSPAQLRGKTIAVNVVPGLASGMVDDVLAMSQVKPAQVHLVVIPFPKMGAALAAHRVDAAFMVEPYLSALYTQPARHQDGVKPLVDMDQVGNLQNFPNTGYMVTRSWLDKYPRTAATFSRALARGQRLAAISRPAVEHALTKGIPTISAKTAAVMGLGGFPLDITASDLTRVADLMQQVGMFTGLGKPVNVTALAEGMTR